MSRLDLSDTMESLIGDCMGPGSMFDSERQHLSTYCFDHYGDMDPEESDNGPISPGSVVKLLESGLESNENRINGPVIDIGCSVGRTSFELADRFDHLVLGVDLNFSMVKIATTAMNSGSIIYPKRRVGIVYDKRSFKATFENTEKLDFWVCDAAALPFSDGSFNFCASLNVLDCVGSPYDFLKELSRILKPKAEAIVSTPYDWTVNATPIESWIGGHSQRTGAKGVSDNLLISLLSGGDHPNAIQDLELVSNTENIPWTLRLHDRSIMKYHVHMVVVKKSV